MMIVCCIKAYCECNCVRVLSDVSQSWLCVSFLIFTLPSLSHHFRVEQLPNSTTHQISVKGSDVKLRMSRSFGDFYLKQNNELPADKQAIIAVPEVIVHTRVAR